MCRAPEGTTGGLLARVYTQAPGGFKNTEKKPEIQVQCSNGRFLGAAAWPRLGQQREEQGDMFIFLLAESARHIIIRVKFWSLRRRNSIFIYAAAAITVIHLAFDVGGDGDVTDHWQSPGPLHGRQACPGPPPASLSSEPRIGPFLSRRIASESLMIIARCHGDTEFLNAVTPGSVGAARAATRSHWQRVTGLSEPECLRLLRAPARARPNYDIQVTESPARRRRRQA